MIEHRAWATDCRAQTWRVNDRRRDGRRRLSGQAQRPPGPGRTAEAGPRTPDRAQRSTRPDPPKKSALEGQGAAEIRHGIRGAGRAPERRASDTEIGRAPSPTPLRSGCSGPRVAMWGPLDSDKATESIKPIDLCREARGSDSSAEIAPDQTARKPIRQRTGRCTSKSPRKSGRDVQQNLCGTKGNGFFLDLCIYMCCL